MNPSELQVYLYEQIPMAKALGILVKKVELKCIILQAPLDVNINHKKTVFGGSLYSIATLACWSLAFLNAKQLNIKCEIVISKGEIDYKSSVTGDFEVTCQIEDEKAYAQFCDRLTKRNLSRLSLTAQIQEKGLIAVEYKGDFVAIRKS